MLFGHGAHQWAFGTVAVAAATKQAPQPPATRICQPTLNYAPLVHAIGGGERDPETPISVVFS
jgi:hypothetical protein